MSKSVNQTCFSNKNTESLCTLKRGPITNLGTFRFGDAVPFILCEYLKSVTINIRMKRNGKTHPNNLSSMRESESLSERSEWRRKCSGTFFVVQKTTLSLYPTMTRALCFWRISGKISAFYVMNSAAYKIPNVWKIVREIPVMCIDFGREWRTFLHSNKPVVLWETASWIQCLY